MMRSAATGRALLAAGDTTMFDQAPLAEGGTMAEPAPFVKRMNEMLLK